MVTYGYTGEFPIQLLLKGLGTTFDWSNLPDTLVNSSTVSVSPSSSSGTIPLENTDSSGACAFGGFIVQPLIVLKSVSASSGTLIINITGTLNNKIISEQLNINVITGRSTKPVASVFDKITKVQYKAENISGSLTIDISLNNNINSDSNNPMKVIAYLGIADLSSYGLSQASFSLGFSNTLYNGPSANPYATLAAPPFQIPGSANQYYKASVVCTSADDNCTALNLWATDAAFAKATNDNAVSPLQYYTRPSIYPYTSIINNAVVANTESTSFPIKIATCMIQANIPIPISTTNSPNIAYSPLIGWSVSLQQNL